MRLHASMLSEDEKRKVHALSLRILSEVGVRFLSRKALGLLARHGAAVDPADRLARIPAELVAQALKTAPRSFTLAARIPAFDVALPSAQTGYALDGAATFARDFTTGARRNAVTRDLADSLRIFDELPLGAVVWPNVVLSDIPLASADVRTTFLSLQHSAKHIQHEVHRVEEVPYILEGLAAVLGAADEIPKRPIFSVCYCTIPPLTHDEHMCEACLELARHRVPILSYPMPACGSTGPAGLFSDIALAWAESLSALVLFQLAEPGTPVICGHAAGIMNFHSGAFLEGAPESTLINGALGEMSHFLGLPNTQAGCLTDAKAPGPQAVMEKMLSTLPLVLSGADVINGIGEIETSQVLILEQLLVDHEIARLCRRLKDGVAVSEDRNLFADIAAVKPGGHFLMEASTLDACRSPEFLMPELLDRNTFDQWTALGSPEVYDAARRRVEEILARPPCHPLPDKVLGRFEDIARRADAELTRDDA